MKIASLKQIVAEKVEMDGAKNCQVQLAVSPRDGAPNFAMRVFEIAPGGHTPLHHHPYEHEIYVMEGLGTVWREGKEVPIRPGDVLTYQRTNNINSRIYLNSRSNSCA